MGNPPAERPHEALRRRLCSQYAQSEEQKFKIRYFRAAARGSKTFPIVGKMRNKAGNKISEKGIEILVFSTAAYPRAADLGYHQRQIGAVSGDGRRNHGSSNKYYFDSAVSSEEASMQVTLMEISSRLSRLMHVLVPVLENLVDDFAREANREEGNPSHCWYHQRFQAENSAVQTTLLFSRSEN
ncbi:hypothetical protein HNY73_001003 [Argiope bruennichi]|uniref:Uncharacterized protein n=1 Tax=Argiope bruennichi TaxID=94029 RepID=A0A8T0FZY6_ARGBR|nr:hypothetical protein HNY73_001003 [Argiope bruennichi]